MRAATTFKILQFLLGIVGAGLLSAAFAVLLPVDWMASAHQWLGLGEFPKKPVTIYLARSTSLLYAVHGYLMLYVAMNLDQHFSLAKAFGHLHIAIGIIMLGIDLTTPMPWYWTAAEGVPIAMTGIAILWLTKSAGRSRRESPAPAQTCDSSQTKQSE